MKESDEVKRGRLCTQVSYYPYSMVTSPGSVIACSEVSIVNHTRGIISARTVCDFGVPK